DEAGPVCDRLDSQERSMHTKTQKLMLQGGLILLGALVVSSVGGWARRATADDQPTPLTAPAIVGELRSLEQSLEATRGELAVARLQLERYEGNPDAKLRLALLAYNRGPGRVQELLDAGKDPQNGYATALMKGYRRKS